MLAIFLRILVNLLRGLRLGTKQSICRISCESFANVKNTYECPCEHCECLRTPYERNEYTTHARRNPLPMFLCVTFILQAILNSRFALFALVSQAFATFCSHFVLMNASKSKRMSYDHYRCLAINDNILRCLRKCCENNKNILS